MNALAVPSPGDLVLTRAIDGKTFWVSLGDQVLSRGDTEREAWRLAQGALAGLSSIAMQQARKGRLGA